jgi:hypothetical protein
MLFVNGGTDTVGIGTATTSETLTVAGGISGSSTLQVVGATTLGSTLNVTGAISGAVGVSGSDARFEGVVSAGYYFGDGSNLTNLPAGPAGPGGIFTTVDASSAYVTSSIAIGAETAASSPHKLAISGSLSASSNISASAFYGDGQNLTNLASAAISSYTNTGNDRLITSVNSSTVTGEANLTFDGDLLTVTGDITASAGVSGSYILGEGSLLTGLGAAALEVNDIGDANETLVAGFNVMTTDMTAPRTFTLPSAATRGQVVRLKVNGSAVTYAATVTGSIDSESMVTIDGSGAALSVNSPYAALNFVCIQTSASLASPSLWMVF